MAMPGWLMRFGRSVPLARRLVRAWRLARADIVSPQSVLPGHYYSPIPSGAEVRRDAAQLFVRDTRDVPGVDLNESGQGALLDELARHYALMPFGAERRMGLRYFLNNDFFNYADGVFLFCMLMHLRPRRIVEVGSGYSSCAILDIRERFFEGAIHCTFIEPDPARLLSLLNPAEAASLGILRQRVQDVPPAIFETLEANDVLFIDSSHVSKVGSDVNQILFRVLPRLRSGVYIHFHDIFYPFEYPESWICEGRTYNESYLLRAFLQYNTQFDIALFNGYVQQFHRDRLERTMPLCIHGTGSSLWLRKR